MSDLVSDCTSSRRLGAFVSSDVCKSFSFHHGFCSGDEHPVKSLLVGSVTTKELIFRLRPASPRHSLLISHDGRPPPPPSPHSLASLIPHASDPEHKICGGDLVDTCTVPRFPQVMWFFFTFNPCFYPFWVIPIEAL